MRAARRRSAVGLPAHPLADALCVRWACVCAPPPHAPPCISYWGIIKGEPTAHLICLISVCVQFCCVTWYGLSYIPYARKIVSSCIKRLLTSIFS